MTRGSGCRGSWRSWGMCSAQVRPLGDVVRLRTDKVVSKKNDQMPYLGLEHMASGSPHPTRVGRAADSVSTNSVFSEGDILFGKLRPYLRKSATAPFDGYCSTDILVLAPKADIVPSFAAHLLRSELVFREATATAIGTRMPRTSWSGLKDLHVFVPHRREQRRIADILDTLDDAIRKTEEIIAKLQQVKQGLLYDLLTWGIDENGELRDPERDPEQFKETVLGRVPKEWRVVPLDELLTRIEAGKSFSAPDYPAGQGEWGILKVSAVRPEGLQAAENKTVTDSSLINPAYEVRPGDLLITRANTYELVGMTRLVHKYWLS